MVSRVGVGANCFRWGQLEYLSTGSVPGTYAAGSIYCECSQCLEALYFGYFQYSKDFMCRYLLREINLSVLSGFRIAHALSMLPVVGPSQYPLLLPPVLQYSQYSDYELFSSIFYIVYPVAVNTFFLPRQSAKKHTRSMFLGNVSMYVCAGFYSAGHKASNISQPRLYVVVI